MDRIKGQKINNLFLTYILKVILSVITIILVNTIILFFMIKSSFLYSANASEQNIFNNIDSLQDENINPMEILLPFDRYGIYDKEGEFIQGNIEEKYKSSVYEKYKKDESIVSNGKFIKVIERDNTTLIVIYSFKVQFKNEILRNYMPGIEELNLFLILVEIIIAIYILSKKNSKKITDSFKQADKIFKELNIDNLDFEIDESDIYEVNQLLHGISYMQNNLKNNLEEKWKNEQEQKLQVQSLMHDIKTPLTIIRGETEILIEDNSRDKEDLEYILESTLEIQNYLKRLNDITNDNYRDKKDRIKIVDFLNSYFKDTKKLSNIYNKNIFLVEELKLDTGKYITINRRNLESALNNIVINGLERARSEVKIEIYSRGNSIHISIKDDGGGFSKEALEKGKNLFFTENISREKSEQFHRGIGLFYSNKIITELKGNIILKNSDIGGVVEIIIPID